jgi:ACS family glucarate transporter-like MFS transporter
VERACLRPKAHPRANAEEIAYIEARRRAGGMDRARRGRRRAARGRASDRSRSSCGTACSSGIYVAQYCINTLTYFFITWFPVYLCGSGT